MTVAAAGLLGFSFFVMMLLGYLCTVLVCGGKISNKLAWALAAPIGMGIGSIIFFLFRRPFFTVEFSLLFVLFVVWLRYRKRVPHAVSPSEHRVSILAAWVVGGLAWVTLASFIWIQHGPHGEWDGRAIWNSHARYLYRAGPVWKEHIKDTAHPDYPLLVPAAIARGWRYMGKDIPEAGGVQLVLIAVSGVTILAASLWELRANSVSFLMPMLLMGTPFYLMLGPWQYADVPVAVYILSTIALVCVYWEREPDHPRLLVLAGFTAGCAAWTKNEGLLFVLSISIALLLPIFWQSTRTLRRFATFSLGLLVPLTITFFFKLTVFSTNDILSGRTYSDLMSKILDPDRYLTIAAAFMKYAGSFGRWDIHPAIPLAVLLAVSGVDRRYVRSGGWITGAVCLGLMLAGYFAIYVISHHSLDYHIPTSLDRLFVHLWPTFLLLAGLATRGPTARPD